MAKKAKYPIQKLAEEDKALISQIFLRYAVKFYTFNEKYHGPKNFAQRLVKIIHSDTNTAALHTVAIAKNGSTDYLFRPGEINQRLAQTLQKSIQQDLEDMMLSDHFSDIFLHPRKLTNVLKQLEKIGVFFNIKTKKEIRDLEREKHLLEKRFPMKTTEISEESHLFINLQKNSRD